MEPIPPNLDELEPPASLPQVTDQQRRFAYWYTRELDPKVAASKAGYKGSARALAARVSSLRKSARLRPWIKWYREELGHKVVVSADGDLRRLMTPEEVLGEISFLARGGDGAEPRDRITALKILAQHYELIEHRRGTTAAHVHLHSQKETKALSGLTKDELKALARAELSPGPVVVDTEGEAA